MAVRITDICISCDACLEECPVEAITPDTDAKAKDWNEINKNLSLKWPVIPKKKQTFSKGVTAVMDGEP